MSIGSIMITSPNLFVSHYAPEWSQLLRIRRPPLCPYNNVLYLGYERALIATLGDSSHELLEALRDACYGDAYHNASEDLQSWWDKLVNPLEPDDDLLYELPRWTDPINYQSPS